MKEDKLYQSLVEKMNEVAVVPPQTIGPFTFIYKKIVPQFKYFPLKIIVIISSFITIALYFVLGQSLVQLVSLLQFGF